MKDAAAIETARRAIALAFSTPSENEARSALEVAWKRARADGITIADMFPAVAVAQGATREEVADIARAAFLRGTEVGLARGREQGATEERLRVAAELARIEREDQDDLGSLTVTLNNMAQDDDESYWSGGRSGRRFG